MGCIVTSIVNSLNKADVPQRVFNGKAARYWRFTKNTLGAEINSVDGLAMTLTNGAAIKSGSDAAVVTGLEIYVLIEAEIIKITGVTYATGVCVIERAQFGTSGATHASGKVVYPAKEAITRTEAGIVNGSQSWSLSDGSSKLYQSFESTINTGRDFAPIESGYSYPTAMVNHGIEVDISASVVLTQTHLLLDREVDAHTLKDYALTVGATAGSIFTENYDAVEIAPFPANPPKDELFVATITGTCVDNAETIRGQYQLVET